MSMEPEICSKMFRNLLSENFRPQFPSTTLHGYFVVRIALLEDAFLGRFERLERDNNKPLKNKEG